MARTFDQTEYSVQEAALTNMGYAARTQLSTVFTALDANVQKPLRLTAAMPTADSKLYIKSNVVKVGDGTSVSSVPSDDTLPTFVDSYIDFVAGTTSGGTILRDGAAFTLPTGSTLNYYRRVYFVYSPALNSVNCTFSSEVAARGSLTDPGVLKSVLDGQDIGYIDIQALSGGATYKTAGSSSSVIENAPGGVSAIFSFGSGGGGGAGGDTSFKLGTITSSTLPIKKGYMKLSDGRELYIASDLAYSLSSISVDGSYYVYIDLMSLGSSTTVSGRVLYAVSTANIVVTTTTPESQVLQRYVPLGVANRSAGSWASSTSTYAAKVHPIALGVDGSLLDTTDYTLIGAVGTAGQIGVGHVLTTASLPAAVINPYVSWFNFADVLDSSGNGHFLTNVGGATFGTGINSDALQAIVLNGTSQYLTSTSSFFDPGDVDFALGMWFKPSSWATGVLPIFRQWGSGTNYSFGAYLSSGNLVLYSSVTGSSSTTTQVSVSSLTGWHHIAAIYNATTNVFTFYIDNVLSMTHSVGGNLHPVGSSRTFWIGYDSTNFTNASFDEFFFYQGSFSSTDLSKTYTDRILTNSSFPTMTAGVNFSLYNFAANTNDGSANGRTLTNTGSATFGTGILGDSSQAVVLNGSSQYLSSTSSFFDPGDIHFGLGFWIKVNSWATGTHPIIRQWNGGGNYSWLFALVSGFIKMYSSTDGTANTFSQYDVSQLSGWHHLAIVYDANLNAFKVYLNGNLVITHSVGGNLHQAGASRTLWIGYDGANYANCSLDEMFFYQGAFTTDDLAKLRAAKYTHNKGLASNAQDWRWWIKTSIGNDRRLDYDPTVSTEYNVLYYDLSAESTSNYISRKLFNAGQASSSKPVRGQTLTLTTTQIDAILPITHGLGVVPEISLKISNGTDYEDAVWSSALVVNSTQIKSAGTALATLYGAGITCILSYSSALSTAVFVPNRFWNNRSSTSAVALSVNDRVFANTSGGAFTGTLPTSPSVGDEIQVCDAKGTFGTSAFTFGRNGQNIMGSAADFVCNISHKMYRAVYVDATYGWAIYY